MATAAPNPTPPDPWPFSIRMPRPLWFGVAAIVVIATGAGLRIGLPIYRQQMAIREVEHLGGKVGTIHGGPEWLRGLVGDEWMRIFDVPDSVNFTQTAVTDTDLSRLRKFDHLKSLSLQSTRISDTGLVHLERLKNLQELNLTDTRITDAGLVHLCGLTELRQLSLGYTSLTASARTSD